MTTQAAEKLPVKQTLAEIIYLYHDIEEELLSSGGEITPEIERRITANESALGDKMDAMAGVISYLKGQATYLKGEAEQYANRAKTLLNSVEGLRERMTFALVETGGERKLKTAKHSFSVSETESWSIRDDVTEKEREHLVEIGWAEWVFKPLISLIKDDVKKGEEMPSCVSIRRNQSLSIR
ncbi:MAG: siphovirus Gp157 family protein [Chlorobiaceae bacterium]